MADKRSNKSNPIDNSAISKLVQDFGLLLIADDFERYLEDRSLLKIAERTRTEARPNFLADAHLEKFLPLLPKLGIEVEQGEPLIEHIEVLDRLSKIEAFVTALSRTVDFKVEVRALLKALRRKFKDSNKLREPYRTKRLISEELERNCRNVMWIVREFHVSDESDEATSLWDVNLWTILLDAQRLHAETGMVHHAFYHYLEGFQASRGAGSPKKYRRVALAALLAECFEDFGVHGRKAVIHDLSENSDSGIKGSEGRRQPKYESEFADFLIDFCHLVEMDTALSKENDSLVKYRKILRKRAQNDVPRITETVRSSLTATELVRIFNILDKLKV